MKKGDIVILNPQRLKGRSLDWAIFMAAVYVPTTETSDAMIKRGGSMHLVVSSIGEQIFSCTGRTETMVEFEEFPGEVFWPQYFKIVLAAGEPDVNKLLEESIVKQEDVIALY